MSRRGSGAGAHLSLGLSRPPSYSPIGYRLSSPVYAGLSLWPMWAICLLYFLSDPTYYLPLPYLSMQYQTETHPSGLRIILCREPSAVTYLGLAVRVGTRSEPRRYYGLAHSIEHMLFKGTRLRTAPQIIQRLEAVGAEMNAYTTKEETILYVALPRRFAHRALQSLFGALSPRRSGRRSRR